jgi:sugar phosphate isomerase/epimerase
MQLGFVSAILPELSLEQVLQFARAEHFACIEVMCWPVGRAERKYAGVTHLDLTRFGRAEAEQVLELSETYQVAISSLGYYPNPLDPDEAAANRAVGHLKKVIKASALLGIHRVTTFVGRDWTKSVEDNWPRFLKTWKPLVQFAADQGVKIGIENCPMLFTRDEWPGGKNLMTTPAIWRRAFSDIPSENFGLNYDPSHFVLQQMDPVSPLREFQDRIVHIHAKDVKLRRDRINDVGLFAHPLEWHQPRIPGYGEMDWSRFMGALMETTYRGPVCIEVEDETFGRTLEGRKNALRVAANVLRPFFPS